MRDGRLPDLERLGEIADAGLLILGGRNDRDEPEPRGVCDRFERLGEIFGLVGGQRVLGQGCTAGGGIFRTGSNIVELTPSG